jgi:prepilin-type N-terminal cleavage/methylation domain-containing protein
LSPATGRAAALKPRRPAADNSHQHPVPERRYSVDGARPQPSPDEGFTLVEVIVAIVLMALVAVTSAGFFIKGDATSTYLQRRQAAVGLADQAMEAIRAVPPTAPTAGASPLVAGRSASAVSAHWAAAPADVATGQLATMTPASDPAAAATPTPTVPFTETVTASGQPYTIERYLGTCVRPATTSGACTATGSGTALHRAVVVVSWNPGPGQSCTAKPCRFVLSSLLDAQPDPLFMRNGGSVGGAVAVAVPDVLVVKRNTTATINLKSNDLGTLPPFPVSFTGTGGAVLGSVALSTTTSGSVLYTAGSLPGLDVVTYTLTDTYGRTSTSTLTVTVTL